MVDWRIIGYKTMDTILIPFENLKISPDRVSWLSLFLSIFVYLSIQKGLFQVATVLLLLVLFLDALDGFLARRRKTAGFKGLIVDTSCDRLSEFIIFFPSKPWIVLAVINTYITLLRLRDRNVFILPLRHIFLILLIVRLLIGLERIDFML